MSPTYSTSTATMQSDADEPEPAGVDSITIPCLNPIENALWAF